MIRNLFNNIDRNLAFKLMNLHTLIIAASNWLVNYKFEIFGNPLAFSAFTIPLVYVASDLTVRLVGKQLARAVVALSFIPGIIVSIFVVLATGAPGPVAVRISLASGVAYLVATLLDVYVFQWFRERYQQWWIAPSISGVVTTIVSTYTFFGSAFHGSATGFMAANWHIVATNQILAKIVIGMIVILPLYGLLLDYLQRKMRANIA